MSGLMTVGFRFPDGSMHAQFRTTSRWTGRTYSRELFDGDKVVVQAYLDSLSEDAGEEDNVSFTPRSYGIEVLDFLSGKVLSMQVAHEYGCMSPRRLIEAIALCSPRDGKPSWGDARIEPLFARGQVSEELKDGDGKLLESRVSPATDDKGIHQRAGILTKANDVLWDEHSQANMFERPTWNFRIRPEPLALEDFRATATLEQEACLSMMCRMQELGFPVDGDAWWSYAIEKE